MAFLKKCLTFSAKKSHFFRKFLGPRDFYKSAVKFSKKNLHLPPPPLKSFLNPYPPPKIFGQAHVCFRFITLHVVRKRLFKNQTFLNQVYFFPDWCKPYIDLISKQYELFDWQKTFFEHFKPTLVNAIKATCVLKSTDWKKYKKFLETTRHFLNLINSNVHREEILCLEGIESKREFFNWDKLKDLLQLSTKLL